MAYDNDLVEALIAKERNTQDLLRYPNVVGVAVGPRQHTGEYTEEVCVQVFVSCKFARRDLPDWAMIPSEVPGRNGEMVSTDVINEGYVRPLQGPDTGRYRPHVPGGCSIGAAAALNTAGTLGGWAGDNTDETIVLLTNNHVVTAPGARTVIPSPNTVLQPGGVDGGSSPGDVIGQTKRIVPMPTSSTNFQAPPQTAVDAAIVGMTVERDDQVLQVAPAIYETAAPLISMLVEKRGRETLLTNNGKITSLSVTTPVDYGVAGVSHDYAQIGLTGGNSCFRIESTHQPFAGRGDSGSLVFSQTQGQVNGTLPVVGLLFAAAGQPFGT